MKNGKKDIKNNAHVTRQLPGRLSGLLTLLGILLVLWSCGGDDRDDFPVSTGNLSLEITSQASSPLTYGIPGTSDENRIERLRILVFSAADGRLVENDYYENGTARPVPVPMTIDYSLPVGALIICVLANEPAYPAYLSHSLDDPMLDFTLLKDMVMADHQRINPAVKADLELPFCTLHEFTLGASPTGMNLHIDLRRSTGKVQVRIAKVLSNTKTVELKSMGLVNVPAESRLITGYPLKTPGRDDLKPNTFSKILDDNYYPVELEELYVYENYPITKLDTTYLAVGLIVSGTPVQAKIPVICGENTGGQYIAGVRRNVISAMTLTVWGEHIKVTYTILDWDVVDPWDKEAGEDDSNVVFIPWQEDGKWDWEMPYK